VRAQLAGIVAGAIDQRRLPAPQELLAHQVHARRINDPAFMPDAALAIEDGDVEPGVIGSIAGRPDDGPDLATPELERQQR